MPLPNERRKRLRVDLHLNVRFAKFGSRPIETRTKNLSSEGFYCLSPEPLTPGEELACVIVIPAEDPQSREDALSLECRARVVRVEKAEREGFFGIACHMENYRAVPVHRRLPG
jgi:c-di-GMP-binding flagellar brake protein YcgR